MVIPGRDQRLNLASPALGLVEVSALHVQNVILTCPAKYYPEEKHYLTEAQGLITNIKYELLVLAGLEKRAWDQHQMRGEYDRLRQN